MIQDIVLILVGIFAVIYLAKRGIQMYRRSTRTAKNGGGCGNCGCGNKKASPTVTIGK